MKKAKQLSNLFLPVVIAGLAFITGCENDLKDLQKISDYAWMGEKLTK